MRMKKQFLKLGTGAVCVSMGWALWVPFVISNRLGGAWAPWEIRLAGIFLLAAGVRFCSGGWKRRLLESGGRSFSFGGRCKSVFPCFPAFWPFLSYSCPELTERWRKKRRTGEVQSWHFPCTPGCSAWQVSLAGRGGLPSGFRGDCSCGSWLCASWRPCARFACPGCRTARRGFWHRDF